MFITDISIRNFLPFREHSNLRFPNSHDANVALVYGDNMRGKTSLLNALRWAFYGEAIDRYGQPIPPIKLINVNGFQNEDWEFEVRLRFTHNGSDYDLNRIAKPTKSYTPPQSSNDFSINVYLQKDGELVRNDLVAKNLNDIVPKQISRFFLFDGELLQEYEQLLADDSDQGKRIKEAIEQALGVPALISGRQDLETLRRQFSSQQSKALSKIKNLTKLAEKLNQLNENCTQLESDLEVINKRHAEIKQRTSDLEGKIRESESKYEESIELEKCNQRISDLESDLENIEINRGEISKRAWVDMLRPKIESHLVSCIDRIEALSHENQKIQIMQLQKIALDKKHCDVCTQALSDAASAILHREIEKSATNLENQLAINEEINALSRTVKRLRGVSYSQSREALLSLTKDAATKALEITRLKQTGEEIQESLKGFDKATERRLREDLDTAKSNLHAISNQREKVLEDLENAERERKSIQAVISADESARNDTTTKLVKATSDLANLFGQASDQLRDDLRGKIEDRATEAFKLMTTDKTYKRLRINDNYGLKIIDEHDREVSLRSAGAEQIVALSLIAALNQTARTSGPIIMDTPFGRLDPTHRSNVLKYLPHTATQVILFVHEGEIRKDTDLSVVASKIGVVYELDRVSSSETRIVRGE